MAYKVLVVDDSQFFQVRLKQIINEHPDLEVVGIAANGQEAIDLEESLRPDIISMDYEMPHLDGISAVRSILSKRPIPIVMFSSMTYEGATITLEALDAGAVDFIPKNFAEVSRDSVVLKKRLHEKLLLFAQKAKPSVAARSTTQPSGVRPSALGANLSSSRSPRPASNAPSAPKKRIKGLVKLVAIGASTGGPVAVSEIITRLPANFPVPIIVAQHMPENFTKAFSERLNRQSAVEVREAQDGDLLKPGVVYVAPGGNQLMVDKTGRSIRILDGDARLTYKPSVDVLFASAASAMGDKVLAIVLTGMGADGCDGAKLLKQKGATIWGQDKDSCVVYGMPAAVAKAGLTDEVLPLDQVWQRLVSDV
ncbi:chemotaxis response regulator protein-glutamate methylesterase [Saccharophagus degradans]|uniref:protein-glutamate methylesterase/protein-glutamine glutaminase n=1 Tax=Saccharophagus degradans TaxID=86304 RepID=UPI001C08FB3A|nr:chemotaxis response regulator protein-glutamate methylesterase [Saccharophagus degradans]MBU2985820.1 chemotaxis response regulator protein-glutamate methylesterase [Saccharophagus degradans]WGP00345.1 chemotaxis response regulator protein-glutamate methylesterase [Saccharophagus degradans]